MKPMVLFAGTHAWEGEKAVHQTNAVRSWLALRPRPRVVLVGNDPGIERAARRLGTDHLPLTAKSMTAWGVPWLDALYREVLTRSTEPLVAFLSADMVLVDGFMGAVAMASSRFDRFMLSSSRWEWRCREEIGFDAGWRRRVRESVARQNRGVERTPKSLDVFAWSRETLEEMPRLIFARCVVDHWLLWDCLRRDIPVVNASAVVCAAHQAHGRHHFADVERWRRDREYNKEVGAGLGMRKPDGTWATCNLRKASWLITLEEGLRPRPTKAEMRARRKKGGGCRGCR